MLRTPKTIAMLSLLVTASLALLSDSVCGQTARNRGINAVDVAVRFPANAIVKNNGQLLGSLMNSGQPIAHQAVRLTALSDNNAVAEATTNAKGEFEFTIPRGGVYRLQAANQSTLCRVWNASQAPPSAVNQVLLTSNAKVVRGQTCGCGSATCDGGCNCGNTMGGFQNCDTCCGEPPILSNCECCGDECGPCCKGRNKLLVLMIGGAAAIFALDDDDGPVEADLGTANAIGTAAIPTDPADDDDDDADAAAGDDAGAGDDAAAAS